MDAIQSFIGKYVEVYCGDDHKDISYYDWNTTVKSIIIGKLISATQQWLELEVRTELSEGKVLINTWSVVSILEPKEHFYTGKIFNDENTFLKSKKIKKAKK